MCDFLHLFAAKKNPKILKLCCVILQNSNRRNKRLKETRDLMRLHRLGIQTKLLLATWPVSIATAAEAP